MTKQLTRLEALAVARVIERIETEACANPAVDEAIAHVAPALAAEGVRTMNATSTRAAIERRWGPVISGFADKLWHAATGVEFGFGGPSAFSACDEGLALAGLALAKFVDQNTHPDVVASLVVDELCEETRNVG